MYIVSVNDVDRDLPGGGSGLYEQWGLLQPPLLLQADVLHQLRYQPYTLQYNVFQVTSTHLYILYLHTLNLRRSALSFQGPLSIPPFSQSFTFFLHAYPIHWSLPLSLPPSLPPSTVNCFRFRERFRRVFGCSKVGSRRLLRSGGVRSFSGTTSSRQTSSAR